MRVDYSSSPRNSSLDRVETSTQFFLGLNLVSVFLVLVW